MGWYHSYPHTTPFSFHSTSRGLVPLTLTLPLFPFNPQVVGWYHSHPHITALPSHVDLGTQMNYQMLDANFVGLIFSVFNRDPKTQSASEQVCCFQSLNNQQRLIPFQVVPSPRLFFDDFIEPTSYFNGAGDDHREADRQSAVMKLATGAIATIFQLYVKEEHEAYNTIEAKFDDVDRDFTSPNFIRRVSNGAAFATAITKIVSVCHDSQVEAIEAKSRIAKARVAALELYRDTLKAKLTEKESKNRVAVA